MTSILDAIPGIGQILDDLITSRDEVEQVKIRLREIDARETVARLGVQRAWLSNKSWFVAGAIPTVLWMVSIVIFFNHILAPLLGAWVTIPTLDLPDWYANLAGTIVLGLFGKKAWDGAELRWGGETVKPAKGEDVPPAPSCKPTPKATPEQIDARLEELCRAKGIKP